MIDLLNSLKEKAKSKLRTIVLVEGNDERVLRAADFILKERIADLIILDMDDSVSLRAEKMGLDLFSARIINPLKSDFVEEFVSDLYLLRKDKGIDIGKARDLIKDPSYFGVMLVHKGIAHGLVSGATHTTADTLRPALQIIKTPDHSIASSFFLMCAENKNYLFADCALNKNPDSIELADIAISTADSAKIFGIEPKVAMLSFSTKGSAEDEGLDKIRRAIKYVNDKRPLITIDGELQVDAAIVPEVAKTKCPNSSLRGDANVLIFPDLNSGNIGYKLVQRFSNTKAIGPIIQGLNKPVNDLSRGCNIEDIINVIIITAIEAQ